MAWVFTGHFLDNIAGDRVVVGTGELQDLPGRFALAGLVEQILPPYAFACRRR
jgi:hypothetical protein